MTIQKEKYHLYSCQKIQDAFANVPKGVQYRKAHAPESDICFHSKFEFFLHRKKRLSGVKVFYLSATD